MPLIAREVLHQDMLGAVAIGSLAMGQALFLAYLLGLSSSQLIMFTVFVGIPVALACSSLLSRATANCRLCMPVVMFASGGFGLLLGAIADFGQFGLFGLVGLCRSLSSNVFWLGPEQLWLKINLMPWTYFGMLVGGNMGMVVFNTLYQRHALSLGRQIGLFGTCNTGMLLGMLITEDLVTRFTIDLGQVLAGSLMVVAMLLGMTLGMSALLAVALRISRIIHTSRV
jgi:hypothetical protein